MDSSHRPLDVYRKAVELADRDHPFALAVILQADGSVPQRAGVKAVIDETGRIWGTLGGGFVEGETQRRAAEACRSKRPLVFDFPLDNAYARDAGAICGGAMRILIDPTAAKDRACYARAADALEQRRRGVLLTTVRTSAVPEVEVTARWFEEETIPSETGFPGAEAVRSCFDGRTPRLFAEESQQPAASTQVLVEPVAAEPLLLIAGGGHIGRALAVQAVHLGFDVTVIDDRAEFTDAALLPAGVTVRCGDAAEELAEVPIDRDTYIVIVTRGHKLDAETLEACIHAPAAYLGMIGSRRKVELIRKDFIESGLATGEEFERVFAPVGLDIGAVTVPEIATSIAAQLIAVRRNGSPFAPPDDTVPR